jgi:hypothetical protein
MVSPRPSASGRAEPRDVIRQLLHDGASGTRRRKDGRTQSDGRGVWFAGGHQLPDCGISGEQDDREGLPILVELVERG